MTMQTKNKLINLYKVLTTASKIGGAKFKYGMLKNLNAINHEIESLKTIEKEIEEVLKEFLDKKNAIITKYGTPNESGAVFVNIDDPNYQLVTDQIQELTEEYKEAIDTYNQKRVDYENLLNEEVTFDFKIHEVSIDIVPDEIEDLAILMEFNIIL